MRHRHKLASPGLQHTTYELVYSGGRPEQVFASIILSIEYINVAVRAGNNVKKACANASKKKLDVHAFVSIVYVSNY